MSEDLTHALKGSPFPLGSTASSVISELDDLFDARSPRLAKIKDIYDRKPPMNPSTLREAGQGYRTNVNTGEMESIIDDITATATQGVLSSRPAVTLKSRGVPLTIRSKIASAYHDLLTQAESFSWFHFIDKIHFEAHLYGFGGATFRNNVDWRPEWQPHFELRFGEDATTDVRGFETFAVHTRVPLGEFFEEVDFDPDVVAQDWYKGWNIPELRKYLVDSLNGNTTDRNLNYTNDYLEAAQALRDGTGWATQSNVRFRKLKLTHLYAKHPTNGKICHYILSGDSPHIHDDDTGIAQTKPDTMPQNSYDNGILYYKETDYDNFEQAVWILAYNFGPSTLMSVRGVGHRAYLHTDMSNRFFCSSIDGAFMAASVMLTAPESDTHGRIPIVRAGPFTIAPAGWAAGATNFAPNFQGLLGMREMSSNLMHNNLGTNARRPENPMERGREKSAAEVNMLAAQETAAEQNRSTYRTTQWTRLHREIFRRISDKKYLGGMKVAAFETLVLKHAGDEEKILEEMKSSKEEYRKDVIRFYVTLVLERIPLDILFGRRWVVTASQGVGAGSRPARLAALQDVVPLVSGEPRHIQDKLRHAMIAERTANPDFADEMIDLDRVTGDTIETLLVSLENNDMKEARQVPVPANVDHMAHVSTHFAMFYADLEAWQAQQNERNTRELYALGTQLVPHLGQHLTLMASDPLTANRVEGFVAEFQKLQQVVLVIERVAQEVVANDQVNRDALAQEISALRSAADDTQGKLALQARELESRIQLRELDTQSQVQVRAQKTMGAQQVKQAQFVGDETRRQESHILRMQRQIQEMQLENEKLRAEIEKARKVTNDQGDK